THRPRIKADLLTQAAVVRNGAKCMFDEQAQTRSSERLELIAAPAVTHAGLGEDALEVAAEPRTLDAKTFGRACEVLERCGQARVHALEINHGVGDPSREARCG